MAKKSRQESLYEFLFIYVYSIGERGYSSDHSFIDFSSRDKSLFEEERRKKEGKKERKKESGLDWVERIVRK